MLLKELLDLKGKTIFITGGSGYLGSSMCEGLAEFHANLIIGSRNYEKNKKFTKELNKKYGNINRPIYLDISNSRNIDNVITNIINEFGRIDVLINNASCGTGRDLLKMNEEEWKQGIDGTVNGVYRCIKAVLPHMIKQESSKIINIASMYGVVSPDVSIYENNDYYNPGNYGAGKAAIIQFTKYIACVYGKYGIRANSISPGPFPKTKIQENKVFKERLENKVPLGRIGNPEDLKGIILLLASDASNYITGTNIMVDGGWTAW
ncbi:SDR family oxidoreductase [Crassaminicella profunda]|uniref:SDR family oxidoreductase n=1 Tax=Crassaminicella profunda TaxID=1286698 RepID=UPI001CA76904|nr:SDR family oxidoreductase [Crassaminicella profunda]QZY56312.1 SDR family oxidoreductase [Crassaminicella profunda]